MDHSTMRDLREVEEGEDRLRSAFFKVHIHRDVSPMTEHIGIVSYF